MQKPTEPTTTIPNDLSKPMEKPSPFHNFLPELWQHGFKLWDAETLTALRNTSSLLRSQVDEHYWSRVWFRLDWTIDFLHPFADGENYGFQLPSFRFTYRPKVLPTGICLQQRTKIQHLLLTNYPIGTTEHDTGFFAELKAFFPALDSIRLSDEPDNEAYSFKDFPRIQPLHCCDKSLAPLDMANILPIPTLRGRWGQLLRINTARLALAQSTFNGRLEAEVELQLGG
jgi:hypothetical protein